MLVVLILLILLMVVGFGLIFYMLDRRLRINPDEGAINLIKQDLVGMSQTFTTTQASMNERLDRAAQVFGNLQTELGKMQELGRSMKDIGDMLKSPKLRGNIGEQLMSDLIAQQIPRHSYSLQYAFRSGEKVDAIVRTKNGLIPIDAKFPAENFLRFTQAEAESDKVSHHRQFEADVKRHIQTISRKYILPGEGTVDFALMYVPGEAVFYDIMTNTNLSEFAAGERVYLVSPHSFYYFLQTVLLSLEGEMIEAKAKEVMDAIRSIQLDAKKFGSDLGLATKHVSNAKTALETANTSFARLGGKIDSASQLSVSSPSEGLIEEQTKVEHNS